MNEESGVRSREERGEEGRNSQPDGERDRWRERSELPHFTCNKAECF